MLSDTMLDSDADELAADILAKLDEMGFVQVKWEPLNDVVMGPVRLGWPAISKDQQWVAFLPWPPEEVEPPLPPHH